LKEVEREYLNSIVKTRPFKVPNYRTGDVVDVTLFKSLSEGKFHKYRGVIYQTRSSNNLNKSFHFHFNEEDMNVSLQVKEYSPLVAKIDMHRYGSN
jgi:ribosomal protein L19